MTDSKPPEQALTKMCAAARRMAGAALIATLLPGLVSGRPALAQERAVGGDEDPARWLRLGSFRGALGTRLAQQASDLLFEFEQDGELYEDLGNLTLGLGLGASDLDFDWDNSFFRAVEPYHEHLPIGSTLTADDLSRYVDIQGAIARIRTRYEFPGAVTDRLDIGIKAERGWSLTVARARQPLVFGQRPLAEVLAERDTDDFQHWGARPPLADRNLVELSAGGIAAIARWIIRGLAKTADTEVGTIFFDNAAEPIALFLNVGIPIPAEMFTADDSRLSEGDRVRQITFVGVSPIDAGIGWLGLRSSHEIFARYLRETTIVKAPGNQVLVSLRHVFIKGQELEPLKFRPELRLLGFLKLGYTFFEQRLTRGDAASSSLAYRIDLHQPAGRKALEALLGEGTDVRYRPLQVAAEAGDGAQLLGQEKRQGHGRLRTLRLRLFSPFRFGDRRVAFSERVRAGNLDFEQMGVARLRDLRKRIGRDRDWKKQFLVSTQSNLRREDPRATKANRDGMFAVNLQSGFRSEQADGAEVRGQAAVLGHMLGPHPIFELLASLNDVQRSDFFANLTISLGKEHLLAFEAVAERRVWESLAEMLLGDSHTDAWATPEARLLWQRRRYRDAFAARISGELPALPQPIRMGLGLSGRYRLARRVMKRFARLQELIRTGDCLPCLSAAFDKQKYIALLQVLLYRLASGPGSAEPGYNLEIFGEPMLSPATLSNGVRYELDTSGVSVEEILNEAATSDEETGTEEALRRISGSLSTWAGARTLTGESSPRLRAGDIYLNIDPQSPEGTPAWKLRLWSDLRFSPQLALRVDLRESRAFKADRARETILVPLSVPTGVIETSFAAARYYYDVALPPIEGLLGDDSYTLLLRVLGLGGRPVSEEQQLRFRWPTGEELAASRAQR